MSGLLTAIAPRFLLSIVAIFLTLTCSLILPTPTWAAASIGINNGYLSACPASNNCVVSQNADPKHAIDPIPYHVSRDAARETLLELTH